MAEYTALYEAGSALVELLRDYMTPEPIAKRESISLCSPHEAQNNQLTVYLFHMEEDQRGVAAGYVQQTRELQRIAPSMYQLSFLITAHSKAPEQLREGDQYRILGAAIQALKDHPVIEPRYFTGSLVDSGATLRLSVEKPTYDQLIKIWNNTASPYKLSIVCKMDSVAIDSKRTRRVSRVGDVVITVDEKPAIERGELV